MGYLARVKVWVSGEILYASDLNTEFDNSINRQIPEPAGVVQGDIMVRGSSVWQRLPAGTAGYFLKTNGAGNNPSWAVSLADPLTATTFSGTNVYVTTASATTFSGSNVDATTITATTISATTFSGTNDYTTTLTATTVNATNITASITSGSALCATTISATTYLNPGPPQAMTGSNIMSLDLEYTNTDVTNYTAIKGIQVPFAGTYTVKFDLEAYFVGTAYGRIYVNGTPTGTEQTNGGAYTTYSQNFTLNAGDNVVVYCKNPTYTSGFGVKNFRIYSNISAWAITLDLAPAAPLPGYVPISTGA